MIFDSQIVVESPGCRKSSVRDPLIGSLALVEIYSAIFE